MDTDKGAVNVFIVLWSIAKESRKRFVQSWISVEFH